MAQLTPLLVVLALGVATGALFLVHQRRTQGQLTRLMERIAELEDRLVSTERRTENPGLQAAVDDDADNDAESAGVKVSGDVLAGHTSFVRRVVDGGVERPASTGELAIGCVHSRLEETIQPAVLASELSISLRTLERGLLAELGCTPRQLILAMKMREARRMLETGRFRVNEVAYRLGFSTPSSFSRRFRSFYHVPPTTVARPPAE